MASTNFDYITIGVDTVLFANAGVPENYVVDTSVGTGAGFAGKSSMCLDVTNGNAYINAGTKAQPSWKLVTKAS